MREEIDRILKSYYGCSTHPKCLDEILEEMEKGMMNEKEIIVRIACIVKNQDVLSFEWVKKIAHALYTAQKGKIVWRLKLISKTETPQGDEMKERTER